MMESIVNCPECGEQVQVVMEPYHEAVSGLTEFLDGQMGIGKTSHFQGQGKCGCGKLVIVSLHVTAGA